MLATGGSAIAAMDVLRRSGRRPLTYVGLIAAPEGIRALEAAHPDVDIYVGAVDSHLNEHGYIVPGLGDAGDRQFGTPDPPGGLSPHAGAQPAYVPTRCSRIRRCSAVS